MTQPPAGGTFCYRHPNREALVRCTRCDRPICPDCMRPASVGFHCPDDVAMGRKTIRPQRTSVGAVLRQSPPWVTAALIAANVAVYVVTGLQSSAGLAHPADGLRPHDLFWNWQLVPITVHDDHSYYRLITSMFLHVSVLHIASNMIALFFVGPALERLLGPSRFLAVYLLGGLGGSAAIYLFGSPFQAVAGASGAIFGLFGACLVLARKLPGLDVQWLVAIIVLNFVFTFSVADISKLGHIGGFVVGGVSALAIGGMPQSRQRVPHRVQMGGLGVILAAVIIAIAVRTGAGMS